MKKQVIMAVFGLTVAQADALAPQDIKSLYAAANAIEADVQPKEARLMRCSNHSHTPKHQNST